MNILTVFNRAKLKLLGILVVIAGFIGMRVHDRRQGAKINETKRKAEDLERATEISEVARDARSRAARDKRDPVDRVRDLGGLRDDDPDRR